MRAENRVALATTPAHDGLKRLLRVAEVAGDDPDAVLCDAAADRGFTGFTDARLRRASPSQNASAPPSTASSRRT